MMLKKIVPVGAAILMAASILPACTAAPTKAQAQAKTKAQASAKSQAARIAELEKQVAALRKQLALSNAQLNQAMKSQMAQAQAPAQIEEKKPVPAVLNFTMKSLEGKDVNLSQYAGRPVLIVNTASKCGNTPQYEGLEKLFKQYKDQGLVVLGFPSADFGGQELDSDAEIASFCQKNFGVSFPMFSKVKVKGEGKAPLFEYLTSAQTNPDSPGEIDWNFGKFLIDRDGKIAARFKASVKPEAPEVVAAIEKTLQPAGA